MSPAAYPHRLNAGNPAMKILTPRASVRALALSCLLSGLAAAPAAYAHVTLETKAAPVGSTYKAVLRVPHGCAGSATRTLRVRIPDGMIDVKPQPKAGWQTTTTSGDYDKVYTLYGAPVKSGVREITWTGDLPDAFYDEFVFRAYLAQDLPVGKLLPVAVVQECEKGISRWIDAPGGKGDQDESKTPAPTVKLLPAAAP
jgi:uncharacterized protein YcnI